MNGRRILDAQIAAFTSYLENEERSKSTIEKYSHAVRAFSLWMQGQEVTKESVCQWKQHLCQIGRAAVTVNGALSALHSFFTFQGWPECHVKYLKVQRRVFQDPARELTRDEYLQLVSTAHAQGKARLELILETIGNTGIRVSEVKYITVEAARRGKADIALKGKVRTILLPGKLCKRLLKYANKQKIACGEIFLTASGRSLSRFQIWSEMKQLCRSAGVDESKVFPHNLRHLFARTFYHASRDVVKLADVLGHSSIETTRLYLVSTGREHQKYLDKLGFLI